MNVSKKVIPLSAILLFLFLFVSCSVSAYSVTSGQGSLGATSIFVMLTVAVLIAVFGFLQENKTAKVVCLTISGVFLLMTILYTAVVIQQSFSDNTYIMESFETFTFVIKILFTVAIVALVIFVLYTAVKMWRIKRGLDE